MRARGTPGPGPNLVVIMSDQQRADAMRCAGNESLDTPNLDRIAAEGIRFSRTSCQGPLCMPARASFLTERYVRDHGVYTNWAEVPTQFATHVQAIRDVGYHTAMLGKAHLSRDENLVVGHVDDLAASLHERGYVEVIETGDKFNVDVPNRYTDALDRAGHLDAYRSHIADRSYHGENETGAGATKTVPMWDATPAPLPLDLYIDQWHGDLAAGWIGDYDRDDPFYLFVGFPGPHDPWDAPADAVARYAGVDIDAPGSTVRPDVDLAGTYGQLLAGMLDLSDTKTMNAHEIEGMRRSYYADISIIDQGVGRIIDALDDRGMLDNTWVVFTSDHGEMAGDHGLMSKCVLYEGAVRVPLLIRPPGGTDARVVDDLVEHIDVPATLREIVGAPAPPAAASRSLLGHFDGAVPGARSVAISENWGFASFETDRWRLIVDEDAVVPCQLFDLVLDPNEDTNLVGDHNHQEMQDELMATVVRPFLATSPRRPHPSPFAPR